MATIATDFYSLILWELLFLELEPWAEEPLHGAKAPRSFRVPSATVLSLLLLNCHTQVRNSCFIPLLLLCLYVASFLYLQMCVL